MTDYPTVKLNDGTTMPQIGLGVWQAESGEETANAVAVALQAGYRMIDTAMVYQNEESVGEGIRRSGIDRKEIFVTTKLWNSDQGAVNARPALQASLERLGLDYVDLYLIHWPTPSRDLYVETWKEFEKLQKDGLTRSIGVSNFREEDLERLAIETDTVPAVNQIELHPYFQQRELRDYGNAHGIRIESWSPIGGRRGSLLEDTSIREIAHAHSKSAAQVVIRWHIQNGLVVIPKSVHEDRIRENFDVLDFSLSESEMNIINDLDTGRRSGPDPATMNTH